MDLIVVNPYSLGSLTEFTFVDSEIVNATNITIPSGAQAGDFALLLQATGSAVPITKVIPSGWTEITGTEVEHGSYYLAVAAYKKLEAGEPGSVITGMTGTSSPRKIMLVFRPNAAISTMTPVDVNSEATSGDPVAQTINMSDSTAPLVLGFGHYRGSEYITNPSATGATFTKVPSDAFHYHKAAYCIFNRGVTKTDGVIDNSDVGSTNIVQSFYFEFT